MCIEDVRLGRSTGPSVSSTSCPAATDTLIARGDPSRTTLILSVTSGFPAILAPVGVSPAAGQGIQLAIAGSPIVLDIQHHGRLVTLPWHASGVGGTAVVFTGQATLEKQ